MRRFLEISRTGLTAILLHPGRSLVTTLALLAVLTPLLTGLAIARGVEQQADLSIRFGADVYVAGEQFGRGVPLPLGMIPAIQQLDGVTAVVPRIVGVVVLGTDREEAVLVGLPAEHLPATITCIAGRPYRAGPLHELIVGTELARRLHLDVGALIPPFYRSEHGERLCQVVGLFKADVSHWQARLILTSFDSAAAIFNHSGLATDLLVSCRPGYQAAVSAAIRRLSTPAGQGNVRWRVTTRDELQALVPGGLLHREGAFVLHLLPAVAVGIGIVLVTSGFGLAERRREVGILKAIGWQTDEVLLRGLVESLLLSLAGAALGVLLAFVWLAFFNGYVIAALLLPGAGTAPGFQIPYRLTPVPALVGLILSFLLIETGTLYSTWRAATAAPREAMR